MKTSKVITIIAIASALLAPLSNANLLVTRSKLEAAKAESQTALAAKPDDPALVAASALSEKRLNDFDAGAISKFGENWIERWQNSKYPNPDDEAADLYISGKVFSLPGLHRPSISPIKQREILEHIAVKPTLVSEDLAFVTFSKFYNKDVAARLEDFAALLPSKGIRGEDYFILKHITLLKKNTNGMESKGFVLHMNLVEWFELASAKAHFSPHTFNAMRNAIIATTARLLIDKRRAAGLTVEGPEFDAAFAPVLAAIKAPKFTGLAEAVAALDIGITIPTLDFSAQEATANEVADAATRNATFMTAWDTPLGFQSGLGSVMFVMGESAYREWREALLQPR